jgi:hypothetical protein
MTQGTHSFSANDTIGRTIACAVCGRSRLVIDDACPRCAWVPRTSMYLGSPEEALLDHSLGAARMAWRERLLGMLPPEVVLAYWALSEHGRDPAIMLGLPVGVVRDAAPSPRGTRGHLQRFEGDIRFGDYSDDVLELVGNRCAASIYWAEAIGAFATYGAIGAVFERARGTDGLHGFPLNHEGEAGRSPFGTVGRYQRFEGTLPYPMKFDECAGGICGATIYWAEAYGGHSTWGEIGGAYEREGGTYSSLGFPTSDVEGLVDAGDHYIQRFEGGLIDWYPGGQPTVVCA